MASPQELQRQLVHSLEQIQALSQEIATTKQQLGQELATARQQISHLDNDRANKDQQLQAQNRVMQEQAQRMANIEATVTQVMANGGGGADQREPNIKLIDLKTMAPTKFAGKSEEPFRTWAKQVRAYCNASRPGFRKCLKWIEERNEPIDEEDLS